MASKKNTQKPTVNKARHNREDAIYNAANKRIDKDYKSGKKEMDNRLADEAAAIKNSYHTAQQGLIQARNMAKQATSATANEVKGTTASSNLALRAATQSAGSVASRNLKESQKLLSDGAITAYNDYVAGRGNAIREASNNRWAGRADISKLYQDYRLNRKLKQEAKKKINKPTQYKNNGTVSNGVKYKNVDSAVQSAAAVTKHVGKDILKAFKKKNKK